MFRRTLARLASEARQPRIKFPDRKASTSADHTPHPHPAAPQDVAKNFDHFQEVFQSGPHFHPEKVQQMSSQSSTGGGGGGSSAASSSGKGGEVVEDIHELPKRFWATPALAIEENEMDAIMGAAEHFL
ncbi:uncharacterized protein FA14DRAFT_166078 [Meira miltonrushii]|uniref:Uncharacterized protein n=1 Tax=Meira miltonrushii TaxID=1280837 RepID=A0A316V2R7_9BASI|nr:uncharacterized protein FA14DRAFT_166078 [Meira miltonrushii]PWN31849.1 hypothetical protein FA14DRAFT_166078 [Meira miltonrushii]